MNRGQKGRNLAGVLARVVEIQPPPNDNGAARKVRALQSDASANGSDLLGARG